MNLVQSYLTKNPCYTRKKTFTPKGLMLHSVGCAQPNASVFINGWNKTTYTRACVHGFIDAKTGTIYNTLPWNYAGWHCSSGSKGSGNNTHIGVEMCEPECITYTGGSKFTVQNLALAKQRATTTYKAAVELFAYLCKQFNLDPLKDGVILSHKEGYARGIASGHADPTHLWDQLGMGYTMDGFRRDVADTIKASSVAIPPVTPTVTPANTRYRVLYGNYSSVAETTSPIQQAKNKGLTAISVKLNNVYHVQCGVFSSKTNAENLLKTVKSKGFNTAYIDDGSTNSTAASTPIKAGDKVKVLNNVTYTGKTFKVYYSDYDVISISGDRVVIGKGKTTTCAINVKNIQKI